MAYFLFFFVIAVISFFGIIFSETTRKDTHYTTLFTVAAAIFGVIGMLAAESVIEGHPKLTVPDSGSYKIGYVYLAGENVNLGIEAGMPGDEHIKHFQFPKDVFDGSIPDHPKKLIIFKIGNFNTGTMKRLRLSDSSAVEASK
jgi:hypothetical protein